MSVFSTTRDLSALQSYVNQLPQTDPLQFAWETNEVGHSPQRTVPTQAYSYVENSSIRVPVPRLGLWTDAAISFKVRVTAPAPEPEEGPATEITKAWGALGAFSSVSLMCGDQCLSTLWPSQIVDWVTSLDAGAYDLWTGLRHLGNGPDPGHLLGSVGAGTEHTFLLPLPFSNLRRRHYLYTPWLQALHLDIRMATTASWTTLGITTPTSVAIYYDFHELSPRLLTERSMAAMVKPVSAPALVYDSYVETPSVVVAEDYLASPVNHYSRQINLTCMYNVFRMIVTVTSGHDLDTLDIRTLCRIRLRAGSQTVMDVSGAKLLKDMVTEPYRHHARGAAVYALQFSAEPHHTPSSRAGQSGFISLAPMAHPHLVVDLDSTYAQAGTVINVTHLYYKAQSVVSSSGVVLQSKLK